jgi:hypothetical protein
LRPREILSPAAPRNAFVSFHVVISAPPNTNYFLYVVPNPLNACLVALYKEHFTKTGAAWIPDALEEVHRLPYFGAMPDPDENIAGQNTRVYLLDLWIPPDANPLGFRLEVQLKVGSWRVAPMEVRVLPVRVPDLSHARAPATLPKIEEGADASALEALTGYLSGAAGAAEGEPLTVRAIIRRNALQDMALAGSLDPKLTGPEVLRSLWKQLESWNENPLAPRINGAEWYLKIRDYIYARALRGGASKPR